MLHNLSMINFNWYSTLIQPPLAPPSWLFSPVWIVLYGLMIVSLIIYITTISEKNKVWGYLLFVVQILLNLAWTPAFFGVKNIGLALLIVILLDIVVIFNIIEFAKFSKLSAKLIIPYLLWILFATYLNTGLYILN